jgi:MFS family permease
MAVRPVDRAETTNSSALGVDRRAMATLSAGHLFTDIPRGSIPALLPFLISKDHLSYAAEVRRDRAERHRSRRVPSGGLSVRQLRLRRYYVAELHTSKALGNAALAAMLLGGAAGTLTGGPLADRFGRRTVLCGSMLILPPLLGLLADAHGLRAVFETIAVLPVLALLLTLALPRRAPASGVTIATPSAETPARTPGTSDSRAAAAAPARS